MVYRESHMKAAGFDTFPKTTGRAYEKGPVWTAEPKAAAFRDLMGKLRHHGYAGKLGYASAGAIADFIIVDMVAEGASGARSPKEAAERAAARAQRYYKV